MKPILFSIFGVPVYGYGMMIAIGIIAAVFLVSHRAKQQGYDEDKIFNMSVIAIICGILGGKLLYIIVDFKMYLNNPKALLDVGSGFVILGAIIAGAFAVYFYSKSKKWEVLKVMDMAIPSIPLAQGFGRIGCFLAGCCYGSETSLPLGVVFKESFYAPNGLHLHPTQLYSSVFDFALAFFLLYYSRKERKQGRVFSLYIILYSIGRFFVEFLRNDDRGSIGVFSTSQFISIITLIIGVLIYNESKLFKRKKILSSEEAELEMTLTKDESEQTELSE